MSKYIIGFNQPYKTGREEAYIKKVITGSHLSGNGPLTKECQDLLQNKFKFLQTILTPSGTAALEMCALLLDLKPGDEVILPSYTFVSTANAFILRGVKLVFADSSEDNPNIDINQIVNLINQNTKAIVIVHYAGISIDMDIIMAIAKKYNIKVVEDAAQSIGSYYKGKSLGTFGDFAALSFHETKNIHCGEGGALIINKPEFITRAEIIRDKGTNRSAFFKGNVNKYEWMDIGSSYLLSEINAAYLFAQCQEVFSITQKRLAIWEFYSRELCILEKKGIIRLMKIPTYNKGNGHIFYLVTNSFYERAQLIEFLKIKGINAVFHYSSLHNSPFFFNKHDNRKLPCAEKYSNQLLRLPLWIGVEPHLEYIVESIYKFYES